MKRAVQVAGAVDEEQSVHVGEVPVTEIRLYIGGVFEAFSAAIRRCI